MSNFDEKLNIAIDERTQNALDNGIKMKKAGFRSGYLECLWDMQSEAIEHHYRTFSDFTGAMNNNIENIDEIIKGKNDEQSNTLQKSI